MRVVVLTWSVFRWSFFAWPPPSQTLRQRFEQLLAWKDVNPDLGAPLLQLRTLVLQRGLPSSAGKSPAELQKRNGRGSKGKPGQARRPRQCPLRGRVWKVLLGVEEVSATAYMELVARGPSRQADDIAADVPRTFRGDQQFATAVHPDALTRVLNAFVHHGGDLRRQAGSPDDADDGAPVGDRWQANDSTDDEFWGSEADSVSGAWDTPADSAPCRPPTPRVPAGEGVVPSPRAVDGLAGPTPPPPPPGSLSEATTGHAAPAAVTSLKYCQGLNTLAGVLLLVMPEVDAFFTLVTLVLRHCPRYFASRTAGVHDGCQLFKELLAVVCYSVTHPPCGALFPRPLLTSLFPLSPRRQADPELHAKLEMQVGVGVGGWLAVSSTELTDTVS